ncbi:MAG: carbonic anhydrase family protein [Verrucomicrobiota bacterium]
MTTPEPVELIVPEPMGPKWSYEGKTGPKHWGDLSAAWIVAKEGKEQSPVDLAETRSSSVLYPLNFSYRSAPLNLVNNGHTIQQNIAPGSSIEVMGKVYSLKQFHFHSASEHTIDGRQLDLEMHLVHQAPDGQLLVVGILFEIGAENPFLAQFFGQLPTTAHESLAVSGFTLNPTEALPEDRSYYYYQGSLTTPPCTEGVQWYILRQPMQLSQGQLTAFRALYANNFRPVQPLNQRTIWETQ